MSDDQELDQPVPAAQDDDRGLLPSEPVQAKSLEDQIAESLAIEEPSYEDDDESTEAEASDTKTPAADEDAAGEGEPAEGAKATAFDPDLLARAEGYGFDAADFDTPGQLAKVVARIDRNIAASGRQEQKPEPGDGKPAATPQPDGRRDYAKLEELYEKELVDEFKTRDALIDRLLQKVSSFEGVAQQQQSQEFDTLVDGLGDAALGKGRIHELPPEVQQKRFHLYQAAVAYANGLASQGSPVPDMGTLVKRMYRAEFGEHIAKQTRQEISGKLRDRKGQFVAPPTHKRSDTLPHGEERARRAVARQLAEMG